MAAPIHLLLLVHFLLAVFAATSAYYGTRMQTKMTFDGYSSSFHHLFHHPEEEEDEPEDVYPEEGSEEHELTMPTEKISVVLDDAKFLMLLNDQDLPRRFYEALSTVSGGSSHGEQSLQALHSPAVFKTFNAFISGNSPIDPFNEAMAKVREHLKTNFRIDPPSRMIPARAQENWTVHMFLFRALLALFQKAFEAGITHKHFLLPRSTVVCSDCAKLPTQQKKKKKANVYQQSASMEENCPVRRCTFKADLTGHTYMNRENKAMLDIWFDDFKFASPQLRGHENIWKNEFLSKYLPERFDVQIVDPVEEQSEEQVEEEHHPQFPSYQMKSSFTVGPHKYVGGGSAKYGGFSTGFPASAQSASSPPTFAVPRSPQKSFYKTNISMGNGAKTGMTKMRAQFSPNSSNSSSSFIGPMPSSQSPAVMKMQWNNGGGYKKQKNVGQPQQKNFASKFVHKQNFGGDATGFEHEMEGEHQFSSSSSPFHYGGGGYGMKSKFSHNYS